MIYNTDASELYHEMLLKKNHETTTLYFSCMKRYTTRKNTEIHSHASKVNN